MRFWFGVSPAEFEARVAAAITDSVRASPDHGRVSGRVGRDKVYLVVRPIDSYGAFCPAFRGVVHDVPGGCELRGSFRLQTVVELLMAGAAMFTLLMAIAAWFSDLGSALFCTALAASMVWTLLAPRRASVANRHGRVLRSFLADACGESPRSDDGAWSMGDAAPLDPG
jgi:hypothetical protein